MRRSIKRKRRDESEEYDLESNIFMVEWPKKLPVEKVENLMKALGNIEWSKIYQNTDDDKKDTSYTIAIFQLDEVKTIPSHKYFDYDKYHATIFPMRSGNYLMSKIYELDLLDVETTTCGCVPDEEKLTKNEICRKMLESKSLQDALIILEEEMPYEYIKNLQKWAENLRTIFQDKN